MIRKVLYGTRKDGMKLYKTYSDNGMMIKKIGTKEIYKEAIDVERSPFVYIETNIPTEKKDEV